MGVDGREDEGNVEPEENLLRIQQDRIKIVFIAWSSNQFEQDFLRILST